jgi:squalene-hopene/tetraprenyl-beta-curcumene cyclase
LLDRAEQYITAKGGIAGLRARYGKDKTFAVPILTNCALAGLVDWREVSPLPFELAAFPQSWYRFFRLPVVSYAIPALVAIGQVRFFHVPPRNPLVRALRRATIERTLNVLERMQPASGGYLEAIPLTSFVVMSLAGTGRADHPVARRGVQFLLDTVRTDGSWPIDTNLATWVTTLAVNALVARSTAGQASSGTKPSGESPKSQVRWRP